MRGIRNRSRDKDGSVKMLRISLLISYILIKEINLRKLFLLSNHVKHNNNNKFSTESGTLYPNGLREVSNIAQYSTLIVTSIVGGTDSAPIFMIMRLESSPKWWRITSEHSEHRSAFPVGKKTVIRHRLGLLFWSHNHKMAAESVLLTRDVTIKVDYCAILFTSLSPFGISEWCRKMM